MNRKFFATLAAFVCISALGFGCTKRGIDKTNTLYYSSIAKIKGLDPIFADDLYAGTEVMNVFDTLLQYNYLKRPYVLEPSLADGMPVISKDGKTYTFKIKKGVVFQDDPAFVKTNGKGRELTAEDFIYSWKRVADPKLNSPQWWMFDGKVVGLNAWHDAQAKAGKTDYDAPVEGLKALDPYTLQISLNNRSYQFAYYLAMPASVAMAREVVEKYGTEILNHAVGTGPFQVSEYNPSAKIVYLKNPTYRKDLYPTDGAPSDKDQGFLADAGKQLPLIDKLVMTVYVETQPRWLTFMNGQLDISTIPKDNFEQAIATDAAGKPVVKPELAQKGIQLQVEPFLDITHYTFNMSDPLVGKNKKLRQAISMAIDGKTEIEIFYNGRAILAQGPLPPGLSGYDSTLKNPYKAFNLAKAKELLKEAGYPDGKGLPPIEYLTQSDSVSRQSTEFLQKQLSAIGVTLKIQTYSWPEFQQSIKNKKGQIWPYAWSADYPDAENFLQLFYSKNRSPGSNDANFDSPQFDKLYEQSLTIPDGAERNVIYRKMLDLLVDEEPWVFGATRLNYVLNQKWTKNYKPHAFLGVNKYYRIETSLRK